MTQKLNQERIEKIRTKIRQHIIPLYANNQTYLKPYIMKLLFGENMAFITVSTKVLVGMNVLDALD